MRSISSNVSFKTYISLLIFCFDDLSIGVSGVLSLLLLLCYCQFLLLCLLVFVLCIEVLLCWCIDIYNCHVFLLDWSLDQYVVSFLISYNLLYFKVYLSDMRIATPAFFCFPFAWNIFFHPLTFSPYVSLGLNWVSCRQHIYGSCFYIHSISVSLLVGTFNSFTFKVIIDVYVPIAIFLIVWGWFCRSFFFSCISWLYKSV